MCGATLSDSLLVKFKGIQNDLDKVREVGINHAILQCRDLIRSGAPGIHFYTLNRSKATLDILENLRVDKPRF
jgi:methylenetetrahydrofolate reductase (NADPH)